MKRQLFAAMFMAVLGLIAPTTFISRGVSEEPPRAPEPTAGPTWETIAEAMRASQTRLAATDGAAETQLLQREASEQLSVMIEALSTQRTGNDANPPTSPRTNEKPATGGNSDGQGTGDAAAQKTPMESIERHGTAKATSPEVKPKARTSAEEFWGRLPPRVRERAMQQAAGRVPPKYQAAVEEYFRQLLEQQSR